MKKRYFRLSILLLLFFITGIGTLRGCETTEGLPAQEVIAGSNTPLDSFVVTTAGKQYKKGALHNLLFGKHYRNLWALPLQTKVFHLNDQGFKIIKKGGNMQTLSLRLQNKDGKKYVLRSVDKDQAGALPPMWKKSPIKNLFRDQTAALNPFGALIIPTLAEAAGIYHTNPELYYVVDDTALGQFRKDFSGRLMYLEEYPDDSWSKSPKFKNPNDIIATEDYLEKRFTEQNIQTDVRMFARTRLFDILIGDWDRHAEQWRWVEFKNDSSLIYQPFPRDRDIAFYRFNDGLLSYMVTFMVPKLQTFDKKVKNLDGYIFNGLYLDNLLLQSLTLNDWLVIADSLKMTITDEKIMEAVMNLPEEAYQQEGKNIESILKSRRNQLAGIAKEFYLLLSKDVTLVGTDENEKINIVRNDEQTLITIKGEAGQLIFSRLFNNDETDNIYIYSLKGDDSFDVVGTAKKGITIHIYSGEGNDRIEERSTVKQGAKKTIIYDTPDGNVVITGQEGKHLSDQDIKLDYERTGNRKKL